MEQAAALDLIYRALDAANDLRRDEDHIPKAPETILVGKNGLLDSLGFATLLLTIERQIDEATGKTVELLDEGATDLDGQLERFRTPTALAVLIVEKLAK